MKNTLNFINLSIDQHWDESRLLSQIFSVRVPNSENLQLSQLDLGIFLALDGDTCIVHNDFDQGFKDFLLKRGLSDSNLLEIKENPYYEDKWIVEFKKNIKALKFEGFNFCGVSPLEEKILMNAKSENSNFLYLPRHTYAKWNNKAFLLKLAEEMNFKLPKTYVGELKFLKDCINSSNIKYPFFIKYVHSSGGGGCFVVNNKTDLKFIDYIQRFQEVFPNSQWLIQEKINSKKEYSTVGYSNEKNESQTLELKYDKNGYSYSHKWQQLDIDKGQHSEISIMQKKLSQWLRDNNYFGPFGFDSICSEEHVYPIIDLNIRYNKGHMILLAAQKLGLADVESYRFRWRGESQDDFSIWWKKIRKILNLNEIGENTQGSLFVPYIFSSMKSQGNAPSGIKTLELSYFVNTNDRSHKNLEPWKDRVEQAILKTTQGEIL